MDGMTIAECIGELPEELIAQGLTPPVRNKKRALRYLGVVAVLFSGIFLGIFSRVDPFGWIRDGAQGISLQKQKEVYEIVLTETAPAAPLYLYTVEPDEEVFAAVKERYGAGFDTAIRIFRIKGSSDEKTEFYLFPLIRDNEVRIVIFAAVTEDGIYMGNVDWYNDFLNTVSNYTSEDEPGYIVANSGELFCISGGKAYCTELFYKEMEYLGNIKIPKGDVAVVRVN